MLRPRLTAELAAVLPPASACGLRAVAAIGMWLGRSPRFSFGFVCSSNLPQSLSEAATQFGALPSAFIFPLVTSPECTFGFRRVTL